MGESILTSIKKLLGITEEYEHFDLDIIFHINNAFVRLYTLGVGANAEIPYQITSKENTWSEFTADDAKRNMAKIYVWTEVKMAFDPPTNSFVMESLKQQAERYEWLLMTMEETRAFGGKSQSFDYDNYEYDESSGRWVDGDK